MATDRWSCKTCGASGWEGRNPGWWRKDHDTPGGRRCSSVEPVPFDRQGKPLDREELVQKAARFLRKVDGTAPVTSMLAFLRSKGLTDTEALVAVELAAGGRGA